MRKAITLREYEQHREDYDGFCTVCEDFTRLGDTEPDASEYQCPQCDGFTCEGAENAFIGELFDIKD
jgi:hypothetical protein